MSLKGRLQLVFLGGALLFVLAIAYFFYGLGPVSAEGDSQVFQITEGERFADIGARLSNEGFVHSISILKLYALISGKAQKMQPGTYELSPTMSVPQIVRTITSPGGNEIVLTIPEGYTLKDIDMLVTDAGILPEGELLSAQIEDFEEEYAFLAEGKSFEGFLFPDTYRFRRNSSSAEVLRRFLDTFEEKAWVHLEGRDGWYEILILASLLEREVPKFEDRQLVAGVLLRRRQIDMPLQVDATISYAKCNGALVLCDNARVTRSDLRIPSPYNTYQRLGFPPGPIANPGVAAIRSATLPEKTTYLYYLSSTETGETIFSETLEEHNNNRVLYL